MTKNNLTEQMEKQNKQPIIVGLDIGTTKVVAIAGRKNEFGKLEILGLGEAESLGVTHGVVLNIDQCIQSIGQALENSLKNNPNLQLKEVYVGIAGQHIKSHQTRGDRVRSLTDDEITQAEVDLLVKDQLKTYIPAGDQIIDVIPQDFIVDNNTNILNPVGMSGVKIGANFHVVTGDMNAIRNIKRCVERSHLKPLDLVLQPLASAASVMTEQDLEAGVCIVDIGGGTTDMAVFNDNILQHTAVIPYAGNNITDDIKVGLRVLRAQAEAMKTQFGMALVDEAKSNAFITIPGLRGQEAKEISMKNLANIIQARTQEILDHVLYELKKVKLDKSLYGGIVLTGGGSQLQHIVQLAEYVTGLSTRIGQPIEHLAGGYNKVLKHPRYATCIGLILRGYSDFESGKLKHADTNRVKGQADEKSDTFIKVLKEEVQQINGDQGFDNATFLDGEMGEAKSEEWRKRSEKRSQLISKIFNQLKNGILSMFEEPEDPKI